MPETLDDLLMRQPPTAARPLLGTVVLLVEDSRHACEGLRMICQRSGARIRRAESLSSAKRHLCAYRPSIAVIDMGLPDGSGASLISELAQGEPRIDGIIAISGNDGQKQPALAAGADLFIPKPIASITAFQTSVLSLLPKHEFQKPIAIPINDRVRPDLITVKDDLCLIAELLRTGSDKETRDYATAFLSGLGKSAGMQDVIQLGQELARTNTEDATELATKIQLYADSLAVD